MMLEKSNETVSKLKDIFLRINDNMTSYESKTPPQIIAARAMAANTAKEPMSFARPDRWWVRVLMRSTTTSIAVFSASTISTKRQDPINAARSTVVMFRKYVIAIRPIETQHSCLNADSCFKRYDTP
jgi:hypothetical protein